MVDVSHFHRLTYFDETKFKEFDISSYHTDIAYSVYRPVGLVALMSASVYWVCHKFLRKFARPPKTFVIQ